MIFFYPASRGIIFFYPAIPQSQGYTFMSFIFRECVKCRRYLHGCLQGRRRRHKRRGRRRRRHKRRGSEKLIQIFRVVSSVTNQLSRIPRDVPRDKGLYPVNIFIPWDNFWFIPLRPYFCVCSLIPHLLSVSGPVSAIGHRSIQHNRLCDSYANNVSAL